MAASSRDDADTSSTVLLVLLAAVLAIGGAFPALVAGGLLTLWIRRATPGDHTRRIVVLVLLLLGAGIAYLLREVYPLILPTLQRLLRTPRTAAWWPFVRSLWIVTLPAAALVALVLDVLLPRRADVLLDEQQSNEGARERRRGERAVATVRTAPDTIRDKRGGDALVLGAVISADLQQWQSGRLLTLPAGELGQHAVAVGASGSGKTETLLRIAALAAKVYGWQVIFLDAKGEVRTAARFLAAMARAGLTHVPFFPTRAYDGWRGDGRALLNRLHAVHRFSEPYYSDVATNVLSLAINAPAGLPHSRRELIQRLGIEPLRELYRGHPDGAFVERLRSDDVRGVYQRFAGFFDALGEQLDGDWALEDVHAAYFLINGTAYKREAMNLGRYLLEEVAHYVTDRKPVGRQVLLIIDEFSAISAAADAANLFERIRSYGASVIVSSQSYAGLGPEAERLLGAANTLILHRCSDPERLVRLAGTVPRYEYSYRTERHVSTGKGTIRQGETHRVDPNTVRALDTGESFVIAGGRAARVRIAPLGVDAAAGQRLLERGGIQPVVVRRATPMLVPAVRSASTPAGHHRSADRGGLPTDATAGHAHAAGVGAVNDEAMQLDRPDSADVLPAEDSDDLITQF